MAYQQYNPSFEITKQIKERASHDWKVEVQRLNELVESEYKNFNEINASAWIFTLAKTLPPFQELPGYLDSSVTKISQLLNKLSGKLNEQGLANVSWAFARLSMRADGLCENLAKQSSIIFKRSRNAKALSATAWGLGELRLDDPEFFKSMSINGSRLQKDFVADAQSCATMCFALSMGNRQAGSQFINDFQKLFSTMQFESIIPLIQLFNAGLLCGVKYNEGFNKILLAALSELRADTGKPDYTNVYEQEVEKYLKSIGYIFKRQKWILSYKTDFFIEESKTIVELQGAAYHTVRNISDGSLILKGSDFVREAILKKYGYKVVHVWDYQWRDWDSDQRKSYLTTAISNN